MVRNDPDDSIYDERGVNGLKLKFCHYKFHDIQYEETIFLGDKGDWQAEYTMCDEGHFITGGQI